MRRSRSGNSEKGKAMRVKNRLTRLAAAVGAVAIGAMGLVTVGGVANAEPDDPSYGNIDTEAEGSITVHKFLNQDGSKPDGDIHTGEQEFTQPVSGVVFRAYPLGKIVDEQFEALDLTDPAAWVGLSNLSGGPGCSAPGGYVLSTDYREFDPTDTNGKATLSDLPVGAYVICEHDASNAEVDGSSVTVTQYANSFIVTIPEPYEGGWIYDVNAFPKNRAFVDDSTRKSIEPQLDHGLVDGSPVLFPVTVVIPEPGDDPWTHGAVSDVFQQGLKVATQPVTEVKVIKKNGETYHTFSCTDAAPGTGYECYILRDEGANAAAVVFTDAGLAKFTPETVGMSVRVVFEAVADLTALEASASWAITNKAGIWTHMALPTDPAAWAEAEAWTNSVITSWGDVKIFKFTDKDGTEYPLSGAEFELYDSDTAYPESGGACGKATSGDALKVAGSTLLRTGTDGEITIPGLFVSDSVNDPGKGSDHRCYVLVETKPPAGYVAETDNIPVRVKVGSGQVTIEVENTQQTVPGLPVTGAAGKLLMMLGALGVGAVMFGLILVNKRRTASK